MHLESALKVKACLRVFRLAKLVRWNCLPRGAPSSPMIASASRVGRQDEMDVPSSDFPEQDDPDYDDLAKEQLHALRADFAETFNRLSDIQAGNRMRASTASQPEKAAMAMDSAAAKWAAATRRPRAETLSEAEEVEAPLQAKASAKHRRKARTAAPQAGAAADSTAMLRQPTVCEAEVLETIATVRRSNVAASVTIHGWVVALKIRDSGGSRPGSRHDLEVRAPGASDKLSGRLRSVDAVKRAMGLLPGATPLEASAGRDKVRAQEGGEPRRVEARRVEVRRVEVRRVEARRAVARKGYKGEECGGATVWSTCPRTASAARWSHRRARARGTECHAARG